MSCLATLKKKGLKLTPQRRMIINIIHDQNEHLTAEDIINHVQSRMPGVNKSTIYRILETLEDAGCVFKSELGKHFIYHHAEEGHHHHLVCRGCGKTVDCKENLFSPIEKSIAETYGYGVNFKHVVIIGLCNECQNPAGH
jgi:Fur family ferric uptake transcriptional regulator